MRLRHSSNFSNILGFKRSGTSFNDHGFKSSDIIFKIMRLRPSSNSSNIPVFRSICTSSNDSAFKSGGSFFNIMRLRSSSTSYNIPWFGWKGFDRKFSIGLNGFNSLNWLEVILPFDGRAIGADRSSAW
jgi:hypothetical protein